MREEGYPQTRRRPMRSHILQPSCQTKHYPQTQGRDDLPDKALQEAREVHQWALEAAQILELSIERLSQDVDRTKDWHPHSHSHSWDRLQERLARSPSPHRPRRHVTFCEPDEGTSSDERPQGGPQGQATGGEVGEGDLGPHPP